MDHHPNRGTWLTLTEAVLGSNYYLPHPKLDRQSPKIAQILNIERHPSVEGAPFYASLKGPHGVEKLLDASDAWHDQHSGSRLSRISRRLKVNPVLAKENSDFWRQSLDEYCTKYFGRIWSSKTSNSNETIFLLTEIFLANLPFYEGAAAGTIAREIEHLPEPDYGKREARAERARLTQGILTAYEYISHAVKCNSQATGA